METRKITALYLCHDEKPGGAFLSLVNLVRSVAGEIVPVVLVRPRGALDGEFAKLGCRVLVSDFRLNLANPNRLFSFCTRPLRRARDSFVNARCVDWVARQLGDVRVDIVHSNSSVVPIGGALAARLGAKHVWHLREIYDLGLRRRPVGGFAAFRKSLFAADAVIATSRPVYDRWNLREKDNAWVIPDAVRPASEIACDPEKDKYVLFCAADLVGGKGAERAAGIFCKSGLFRKGYRLRFVGNCPPECRKRLEDAAAAFGQPGAFDFRGYQPDVKPHMLKAAAFLMCAEFEGLGRVSIEAMFYGCPVLGLDSGGTKDIVEDGRNGLLFSEDGDAAEKLRLLVEDPALAARLSAEAARDALERFSEEAYGRKIADVYRKIL